MYVERFIAGPIETNAFLVADPESREALIVDAPPDSAAALREAVEREGFAARLIVLTHAHFDHVVDAPALKEATGAPLAAHRDQLPWLQHPGDGQPIQPDQLLAEGDTVALGRYQFRVLETPGHAPGQISLYEEREGVLFGGDTLFPGGYGRVDLPGSSVEQTVATLAKLLQLPDETTVFPGHGEPTGIGAERPWMTEIVETARS